MLEKQFRDRKVIPFLSKFKENVYFFIKEAKNIRGIPDIICCVNGIFVAIELKRNSCEAHKNSGSIVFQRYTMSKIDEVGGVSVIVYPENFEAFCREFTDFVRKTNCRKRNRKMVLR